MEAKMASCEAEGALLMVIVGLFFSLSCDYWKFTSGFIRTSLQHLKVVGLSLSNMRIAPPAELRSVTSLESALDVSVILD